jgi:hypothetical protein
MEARRPGAQPVEPAPPPPPDGGRWSGAEESAGRGFAAGAPLGSGGDEHATLSSVTREYSAMVPAELATAGPLEVAGPQPAGIPHEPLYEDQGAETYEEVYY